MSGNYREEFPDFDAHDDIAALLARGGHDVNASLATLQEVLDLLA